MFALSNITAWRLVGDIFAHCRVDKHLPAAISDHVQFLTRKPFDELQLNQARDFCARNRRQANGSPMHSRGRQFLQQLNFASGQPYSHRAHCGRHGTRNLVRDHCVIRQVYSDHVVA